MSVLWLKERLLVFKNDVVLGVAIHRLGPAFIS